MKNWPWYLWVVFFALIALLGFIAIYTGYLLHQIAYLKYYLIAGAIFLVYMVRKTKQMNAEGYELHIHHYFLGMIVMTCLGYQSPFITFVSAIFNGITLEGGSTYGYDPIYEPMSSSAKPVS